MLGWPGQSCLLQTGYVPKAEKTFWQQKLPYQRSHLGDRGQSPAQHRKVSNGPHVCLTAYMSIVPHLVIISICEPWDNPDKLFRILCKADMLPMIDVYAK